MNLIGYAIQKGRQYYDENTLYHAIRVAAYVTENNLIPTSKQDNCIVLAIMHDLLEDTSYEANDYVLGSYLEECLQILTRNKEVSYEDYLKNIKEHYTTHPEAYWVKLADMKDHLMLKETLTDKLRDKYLNAIPELL